MADPRRPAPSPVGLLLAAGAGRRMGGPKALRRDPDGRAWVQRVVTTLDQGGCGMVVAVVGASAPQVRELLAPEVIAIEATRWAEGMGASLRAGLHAVQAMTPQPDLALVTLVDLPGITPAIVARLLRVALDRPDPATVVLRAAYAGDPGHPVVLGRRHWAAAAASATGDRGARAYLTSAAVELVECGDIGHGDDVDTPPDPPPRQTPSGGERD